MAPHTSCNEVKVLVRRLTEEDLITHNIRLPLVKEICTNKKTNGKAALKKKKCTKTKENESQHTNRGRKPTAQELISQYATFTIPKVTVLPPVSTSPSPENMVPENQTNNNPKIRVKSAEELGITKDHTSKLVNLKMNLDLSNMDSSEQLSAIHNYYFTQERIGLARHLKHVLRLAVCKLCISKQGITNDEPNDEDDNTDVLKEFSQEFVFTFSTFLQNVEDDHKTKVITILYLSLMSVIETNQVNTSMLQTIFQRLFELESFSDKFNDEVLKDGKFEQRIRFLKQVVDDNVGLKKIEPNNNLVQEKEAKLVEKQEHFQKDEQFDPEELEQAVCWRNDCESKANTTCHCLSRSYCSQQCQEADWVDDHWQNCRGMETHQEYLVTQT